MDNKDKIILHLCASEYGSDTRDYREAGYDVRLITKDVDVRKYQPPENVYGIFANPPCTMFSKARTRAKKPRDMMEGMELVMACLKIIWTCQARIKRDAHPEMPLKFWALENPDGYLKWFLGKPAFQYQPYEFGGNHSKKTNLWGMFNEPRKPFFNNQIGSGKTMKHLHTPMSEKRNWEKITDLRSIAPPEFTRAFFLANP